jgi:hypothetical protein
MLLLYFISIVFAFLASGIIRSKATVSKPSLSSAPFTSTSVAMVNDFEKNL